MTEPLIPLGLARDTTIKELIERLNSSLTTSDSSSHRMLQEMVNGIEAGLKISNFPSSVSVSNLPTTQPVSVGSLPLPTGAATQATLATALTRLESILSKLEGTVAVSASSLPLPTGAATQTTLASTLVKLEGILTRLEGTLPVSASSLPLPTGAATQTTLASTLTRLESILAKLEGTLAVSAVSLPLPSGAATQTTLAASVTKLEAILAKLEGTLAISAASLPLPAGAATQTTLASILTTLQGTLTVGESFTSRVITTAATTKVKEGAGVLHTFSVLGGVAGSITIYDNTKAEGTVIVPVFTLLSIGTPFTITCDVSFSNGLTVVTGAATAVQVSYR